MNISNSKALLQSCSAFDYLQLHSDSIFLLFLLWLVICDLSWQFQTETDIVDLFTKIRSLVWRVSVNWGNIWFSVGFKLYIFKTECNIPKFYHFHIRHDLTFESFKGSYNFLSNNVVYSHIRILQYYKVTIIII